MLYPWQSTLWQQFLRQIEADKLPHAILLTGDEGVGKLVFAQKLAQHLLCELPDVDQAKNQALFESESGHPDCYHLSPEGKMGMIKIDSIRELANKLTESPLMGGYRIVILESAHCMNIAASNALLKTLEEPGERVCIILVTSEPSQLLPTIKSRCQRYPLVVDAAQGKAWLAQQIKNQAQCDLLWQLSHGAPLQALALSQGDWLGQRQMLLKGIINRKDPIALAGQLYQKTDKQMVLNSLMGLVVDLKRVQAGQAQLITNIDIVQPLTVFATQVPAAKLDKLYAQYCEEKVDLSKQVALNEQLLLESWLIAWHQ